MGSVFAVWKDARWHLVGLVTGQDLHCAQTQGLSRWVNPIGAEDAVWIQATARNGAKDVFTCYSGISLQLDSLCDGKADCARDSPVAFDEHPTFCSTWKCPASSLTYRAECRSLAEGDDDDDAPVAVDRGPANFEDRGGSEACPPVSPKEGVLYRCIPPNTKGHAVPTSCARPSEVGTKLFAKCAPNYRSKGTGGEAQVCNTDGVWKASSTTRLECARTCGTPSTSTGTRIVNGTQVRVHSDYPWNAALFKYEAISTRKASTDPAYICGATLISSDSLLTAAHCVTDLSSGDIEPIEKFVAVLAPISSEFRQNSGGKKGHSQIVDIGSIHVHDNYNPRTFEADIAVLKLQSDVRLSSHISPVCVPTAGGDSGLLERAQTRVGSVGTVLGFGADGSPSFRISPRLQMTQIPVVGPRECRETSNLFPTVSQFCAGVRGTSVCNGDSGGGLVFEQQDGPKAYYIQGVVSHGEGAGGDSFIVCDPNKYSIFTRVGAFKPWLEEILTS